MKTHINQNDKDLLIYLLLLTGFFLLIEISFFIQCNASYFSDYLFMSSHLTLPWRMLPGILFFIAAQLVVHSSYCIIVWIITTTIANFFKLSFNKKIALGVSIWLIGLITIIAANQYFFPNAKFAELSAVLLSANTVNIVLIISLIFASLAIFLTILINKLIRIIFVFSLLSISYLYLAPTKLIHSAAATKEKPNIIIVGVDSLRPDFLSFFGKQQPTPFFDSFLKESTVFSEAITPLARTFPSWISLLTGEYPKQNSIRTNLSQQSQLNVTQMLPFILKKQGYETLYAADETRFSNIDKSFGFDQIVTPPMGLNDFLLGSLNDFPMSNLLINTPIGKWLFPYSYANRPAYFVYEPDSFLKLIKPHLQQERKKPLFLAIHFCLPHHPYLWASLPASEYEPLARYKKSISRVDQQLNDFFSLLRQAHLLDHAIVVLLSDHGEALNLPGDRITEDGLFLNNNKKTPIPQFYASKSNKNITNQSIGHGTDVLSLPQYHTLLAFKLYGAGEQQHRVIPGTVSLLAVKPTLLELINKDKTNYSLAPMIAGGTRAVPQRHLFIESDFTPEAIFTVYPDMHKVLLEGVHIFQIDPDTTHLTVKTSMEKMIINSKQYADIYGDWMLALYPQNDHYRMPILINLTTGKWTNNLQTTFAKKSPATKMLQALQNFYGNEVISPEIALH